MELLPNIHIDNFSKKQPNSIYFLTHWHADHYSGLTKNWSYGPIFCSLVTRRLLLTKFPELIDKVFGVGLGQWCEVQAWGDRRVRVMLFDANHIAGSVMFLFHMLDPSSYILHTGDMRFNSQMLTQTPNLFRYSQQTDSYSCRYHIDILHLDNTYCDPIFMFPNRSDAVKIVESIILELGPATRKFYLVTDSIGKEEAFLALALRFGVKVTVSGERMEYIKQMYSQEIVNKIFCTTKNSQQQGSWLQVLKSSQLKHLEQPTSISIKLTGWTNLQTYYKQSQNSYIVPYSLHSNYQELELFVSVVRPNILLPVVKQTGTKSTKFRQTLHGFGGYFGALMFMKQRGLEFFNHHYLSTQQKSQINQHQPIISDIYLGGYDENGNWIQNMNWKWQIDFKKSQSELQKYIRQLKHEDSLQVNNQSDQKQSDFQQSD